MAEVVMASLVESEPLLKGRVQVTSAGTANWHVGSDMDPRARAALDRAGYHGRGSLAAFADRACLDTLDLCVVMTREHRHDVLARRQAGLTVVLIRSLVEPEHELDLADPYYGGHADFDDCLETITQSCRELARALVLGDGEFVA